MEFLFSLKNKQSSIFFFLKVVKIFAIQGIVISNFSKIVNFEIDFKDIEFFKMYYVEKFEIAFLS